MVSKKTSIRWRTILILFSLLMGSVFFLYEEYAFLSLNECKIFAPSMQVEEQFWRVFPADCVRSWPALIFRLPQMAAFLERTIPIKVSFEADGFGVFDIKVSPLSAWLYVEWRGRLWYLSESGFMWDPSLLNLPAPHEVVWELTDTLFDSTHSVSSQYQMNSQLPPDGVFPVIFPVAEIKSCFALFDKKAWAEKIQKVILERRAGEYIIKVSIMSDNQKILLVAQKESEKWRDMDTLLSHILPQVKKESGDFIVDMTYSNKVVITRGAQEGSSK